MLEWNFLSFAVRLFVEVCPCADFASVNTWTGGMWNWCGESPMPGPGWGWSWRELLLLASWKGLSLDYSEPLSTLLGVLRRFICKFLLEFGLITEQASTDFSLEKPFLFFFFLFLFIYYYFFLEAFSESKYLCITLHLPMAGCEGLWCSWWVKFQNNGWLSFRSAF